MIDVLKIYASCNKIKPSAHIKIQNCIENGQRNLICVAHRQVIICLSQYQSKKAMIYIFLLAT